MENERATLANNLVILKKLNMFLHDPAMLFLVIYTRELKIFIPTKNCIQTLIVALLITAQSINNPNASSVEQDRKMWYIHATKYNSAIESNKIFIHPKTWINLKKLC